MCLTLLRWSLGSCFGAFYLQEATKKMFWCIYYELFNKHSSNSSFFRKNVSVPVCREPHPYVIRQPTIKPSLLVGFLILGHYTSVCSSLLGHSSTKWAGKLKPRTNPFKKPQQKSYLSKLDSLSLLAISKILIYN